MFTVGHGLPWAHHSNGSTEPQIAAATNGFSRCGFAPKAAVPLLIYRGFPFSALMSSSEGLKRSIFRAVIVAMPPGLGLRLGRSRFSRTLNTPETLVLEQVPFAHAVPHG
jgi:hypothetical protein